MFRFFEKLVDPFPPEHPTQPPRSLFAFCRHYTKGIERHLAAMALLTACLAIGEGMLYGVLGQVVDWLTNSDPQTFISSQWKTLVAISVFILIVMPLIVWLHSSVVHQTLMGNYPMMVRWRTHRYLLGQSYSFFQNEFSGRIATKVMQTALAVRESVMKLLDVILFASVYFVTGVILLANADIRLAAPMLIWLLSYIAILRLFVPRLRAISERQADARSTMTGRIVDSYTNILTIKLFSHSARENTYIQDGMQQFLDTVHPQMRLVTILNVCLWSINMLLVFGVSALGIQLWLSDAISTGAIAIGLSLSLRLVGMSHWIMWEVSSLFENIGTVQDGINTIAEPQRVIDTPSAPEIAIERGNVHFQKMTFGYNTSVSEPVFKNFSLEIKAGEKIGVVGRSGSGKSTLVNLLLRFYDVNQGSIAIDGQDIASVQQESLRANIGMVTQDTSLLHRSVRENIKFGRPQSSDEEMIQAAIKASAHEFILQLQDAKGRRGYDAHVGERGVSLSGGQRQRIAIARVLLKDAPILILDEATSALDSEVELSIQQSLNELMANKTVIAIAHRLSTIAALDRLIVLDKGNIVEQGNHHQLVTSGGLYQQLWEHQSGGFLGLD